jgi:hypothetical protein
MAKVINKVAFRKPGNISLPVRTKLRELIENKSVPGCPGCLRRSLEGTSLFVRSTRRSRSRTYES